MKPTRCTLLLSIFISTSLYVSGNCVPIIRTTYCICAILVFLRCMGGCLVDWSHPNQQTRQPPVQSEKYQYHTDTVLLMMGTQLPETYREVEINILRSSVHIVGFI